MADLRRAFGSPPILPIKPVNEAGKTPLLRVTDNISSATSEALTNAAFLPCEVSRQVGAHAANN